jgi:hypothetical protein
MRGDGSVIATESLARAVDLLIAGAWQEAHEIVQDQDSRWPQSASKIRPALFAAPVDAPLDVSLRTVMSAIEAGISCSRREMVAEGQAMLEQIERKVRASEVPSPGV